MRCVLAEVIHKILEMRVLVERNIMLQYHNFIGRVTGICLSCLISITFFCNGLSFCRGEEWDLEQNNLLYLIIPGR